MSPLRTIALAASLAMAVVVVWPTYVSAQKRPAPPTPRGALTNVLRGQLFSRPLRQNQKLNFLRSWVAQRSKHLAISVRSLDRPIRLTARHAYEAGRANLRGVGTYWNPGANYIGLRPYLEPLTEKGVFQLEVILRPSHAPQAILLELDINVSLRELFYLQIGSYPYGARPNTVWDNLEINRSTRRINSAVLATSTRPLIIVIRLRPAHPETMNPTVLVMDLLKVTSITLTPAR